MTAAEIATTLGRAHRSGGWWRAVCRVHGSRTGRSATLALRDSERGLIVHCHAGCDPRDVLAELRRCGLIDHRGERRFEPLSSLPRLDDDGRRIAAARRLWDTAVQAAHPDALDDGRAS